MTFYYFKLFSLFSEFPIIIFGTIELLAWKVN